MTIQFIRCAVPHYLVTRCCVPDQCVLEHCVLNFLSIFFVPLDYTSLTNVSRPTLWGGGGGELTLCWERLG
jgi:hypothetical protein